MAAREDHETIRASKDHTRKRKIVDSFAKVLEIPDASKEGFARVELIKTHDDANALLRSWGILL